MSRTFGYNPASQITSRTRDNDAYAWTGGYTVSRTHNVNGLNQYTAAGSASFGYDANGNLITDGTNLSVGPIDHSHQSSRATCRNRYPETR